MTDNGPLDPGNAILGAAQELRAVATALGATYLSAHIPAAEDETIVLAVEAGRVTMIARGFEQVLLEPPEPDEI